MEVITTYENKDRKANVVKQTGVYSASQVYFVEYFIGKQLVGRTQHPSSAAAELIAEQYTDCLDSDVKQFLTE